MAGMIKTDVVGLKTLYDTFKDNVQRADDIQKPTDSALDNAVWESTNATAFRETWALFKPQRHHTPPRHTGRTPTHLPNM